MLNKGHPGQVNAQEARISIGNNAVFVNKHIGGVV